MTTTTQAAIRAAAEDLTGAAKYVEKASPTGAAVIISMQNRILNLLERGEKSAEIIRDAYPGLETIYTTPHVCECTEHLSDDWDYCPGCGRRIEGGGQG